MVSELPNVENYVYITNVKLMDTIHADDGDKDATSIGDTKAARQISSIGKHKKRKRILFCIISQVSITVVKNKNKRRYH